MYLGIAVLTLPVTGVFQTDVYNPNDPTDPMYCQANVDDSNCYAPGGAFFNGQAAPAAPNTSPPVQSSGVPTGPTVGQLTNNCGCPPGVACACAVPTAPYTLPVEVFSSTVSTPVLVGGGLLAYLAWSGMAKRRRAKGAV